MADGEEEERGRGKRKRQEQSRAESQGANESGEKRAKKHEAEMGDVTRIDSRILAFDRRTDTIMSAMNNLDALRLPSSNELPSKMLQLTESSGQLEACSIWGVQVNSDEVVHATSSKPSGATLTAQRQLISRSSLHATVHNALQVSAGNPSAVSSLTRQVDGGNLTWQSEEIWRWTRGNVHEVTSFVCEATRGINLKYSAATRTMQLVDVSVKRSIQHSN